MRTYCIRCKQTKTPDHFYGDYVYCKECKRAEQGKRYAPIKAGVQKKKESCYNSDGTKKCRVCLVYKEKSEYDYKKTSWDSLSHECKECRRSRVNKTYNGNREHELELSREWYKNNRDKKQAKAREWQKNNPEASRAVWHRYSGRKRNADGKFTKDEWMAVLQYYCPEGLCLGCKENKRLTVDHVIPLVRGGRNSIDNIQPLCQSCNSTKGDERFTDYRPDKGEFSKGLIRVETLP